eukprot:tig00021137_g18984.t1
MWTVQITSDDRDTPAAEALLELLQARKSFRAAADYYGVPGLGAKAAGLLAEPGAVPAAAAPGLLLAMLDAARSLGDPAAAAKARGDRSQSPSRSQNDWISFSCV